MVKHGQRRLLQASELPSSDGRGASRDDIVRPWCRSHAGRQPLGMGEAVGRENLVMPRVQQLGGLHQGDGNYHRRGDAEQCWTGLMDTTSLRGYRCIFGVCSPFQQPYPRL